MIRADASVSRLLLMIDDWDDGSDWDGGEDDDLDRSETVSCPSCGVDVYEDAEQCPSCGEWITSFHSPWQGRSTWWIVLGILGVAATILALAGLV